MPHWVSSETRPTGGWTNFIRAGLNSYLDSRKACINEMIGLEESDKTSCLELKNFQLTDMKSIQIWERGFVGEGLGESRKTVQKLDLGSINAWAK